MPFLIAIIIVATTITTIQQSIFRGESSVSTQENIEVKIDIEMDVITSFLNAWVNNTDEENIPYINFETLVNDEYVYSNASVLNSGFYTTIQLNSSDNVWSVIPYDANSSNAAKILIDIRNNATMMDKPFISEKYIGEYICNTLYNGNYETNALIYDGISDYTMNGSQNDGVLACTYYYEFADLNDTNTTPPEPQDDTYYLFADGDLDYFDSLESPSVCHQLINGEFITTSNANQAFTFFTSQDGSCEGKNKTYDYDKIKNKDSNNNFEINVEYKKPNTAPQLRDR